MSRVKKQHYVPQLYLKHFTYDGTHVCVFDKFTQEKRYAATRDIAEENYFYDPSVSEATDQDEESEAESQSVENLLGTFESDFGHLLRSLHIQERRYSKHRLRIKITQRLPFCCSAISTNQQRTLSLFIALQFFRTRVFREVVIEGYEKGRQAIFNLVSNLIAPQDTTQTFSGAPSATIGKEEARRLHAEFIRDLEFLEELAHGLAHNHYWIYGINCTGKSLYTSDHPVVRQAHVNHSFLGTAGLLSPGVEIALPLSPRSILLLYERSIHKRMKRKHRRFVELCEGNVQYYNSLQARESFRQIYCSEEDFTDAIEFCRKFPEACRPGRSRIHVGGIS
jgi:Protein of unknown function (DUF4238)